MLEQIAHYKILDRIGAGGMGEVYRARDTKLGRTVAIKVLPDAVAANPENRDRFMREAQAVAALSHPNIAALFEVGEDQGHLFLVFEFVAGQPLSKQIAGRPMNPRQAAHLAIQIADALAEAHGEGIVHRDIKPDNIIVTAKGHAKILDFGLAKWTAGGDERDRAVTMIQTGSGVALGTVAYMSPEQALGEAVDLRTDIFSLGIVLFEMLTGTRPFQGGTSTAVALQIVQAPAPAPSSVNGNVPTEFDPIVAKALAKQADARYASAAALAAELRAVDAILDVRSEASERSAAIAAVAKPRRGAVRWIAAAAIVVAIGVAGWTARGQIARAWRRTLGPPPAPVIAVVPFETDADHISFADGLAEDLITRIGQTPGIKVLGRSATRSYRGRTPQEVARDTGAAVVLTGSVRPADDTVKMSLELVNPADATAIWSNQYTREVKDIFAVQAEVAKEVAAALRVTLRPTPATIRAASRTVDPRAYDLYVRGRQAVAKRHSDGVSLFEQAIAVDPGIAEAFAGIAESMEMGMIAGGVVLDRAGRQRQRDAAERAYQLDPDLPQANLAMALATPGLKDALGYLRRAVEIDPSYGEGWHQIGDQINDFDPQRAIQFYRASLAADPGLEAGHTDIGLTLGLLERYDEGHAEVDRMRADPIPGWRTAFHVLLDLDQRRYDRALVRLEQPMPDSLRAALRVTALASAGRFQEALRASDASNDTCPARAVVAAVRRELGDPRPARALWNDVSPRAQDAAAEPEVLRCAAQAAAAMNDAQAVASLLRRIAGREESLRFWALQVVLDRGSMVLKGRVFPWNRIVGTPAVMAATQTMDDAYARERALIASALEGLLQ